MAPTNSKNLEKGRRRTVKEESNQITDPLRNAISALEGDDEDYELLKGVDDGREMIVSGSHADSKLASDVAKFIKGLQIPGQQSKWVVDDGDVSGGERSGSDDKEEDTNGPPPVRIASAAAPAKGKAPRYLFPPTPHWYSALPPLPSNIPFQAPSEATIASLSSYAESLLKQDVDHYSHTESSSDAKFLSRVLTSGTLSDRLSALTLMVQASPLHNQKALEGLKSMAGKKSRSESLKSLRAIVDWWVGGGSPDSKLKYFRDQPLNHPEKKDDHLMVWYYEDWLKKFFFSLLQTLESLTLDPLPYVRTQAMALVSGLLIPKPEQEHNLLRLLVNKLGDSERSVASKASYHLLNILQAHPQMKGIMVREVAALMLKAPTSTTTAVSTPTTSHKPPQPAASWNAHARYFAVITFNQIVLSKAEKEVAGKLVDVYFELFKAILGEGKETDGAVTVEDGHDSSASPKAIAKGREGRRARAMGNLNYTKATGKGKEKEQPKHEFAEAQSSESKVISAILTGVNRALPFAGVANETLDKHIDTLFRISHSATFNVSIQSLVLMQHVSTSRPAVQPRYYRALYATLLDSRLASGSKQAMFLNLLFKSLKVDPDLFRVKAFVKRFLQVLSSGVGCGGEPSFICGGLFLLGELFTTTPGLRDAISQPEQALGGAPAEYDPRKREPEYCGAAGSCIWELIPLLSHYHPSVSLHARQLLEGAQITATADLGLNTLSHFLDLFVYKNPRKPKPRGTSAMQPAAALGNDPGATVRLIKGMGAASEQGGTVNNEAFWRKKVEDVPVNQLFFHRFFMNKMERTQAIAEKVDKRKGVKVAEEEGDIEGSDADVPTKSKGKKVGVDGSSSDEELDEHEVWKAMKSSMPEVAGPDSDESDSLPEDLDGDSDDASVSMEKNPNEDESDGEGWGSGFGEDSDDLVGSDIDAPDGLLHLGSDGEAQGEEPEEWGGIGADEAATGKKRKAQDQDGGKRKRRRLRDLPTFASAEQYAELIEEADEENL